MKRAAKTVNLDAMIPRADFAVADGTVTLGENQQNIGIRDFLAGALLLPNLRKPDFQRETNHWVPEQVAALVQSFMDGDLIPAVILWRSDSHVFVIDGGHRLSAMRAWIDDDYGDGVHSRKFFGNEITDEQINAAQLTRQLVEAAVGRYQHWFQLNSADPKPAISVDETRRLNRFATGSVTIQWVHGSAEKAESSFFKINTKGTPLDETEELLIANRHKPIAIAARSIIRSGMGHKYWSAFPAEKQREIEARAKKLNELLFEPEFSTPIKTLDLPLGGTAGVRNALTLLIELILVANRNQQGKPEHISDQLDDTDGTVTVGTLDRTIDLVKRMTGDVDGSLGLHPAVYFYSATGRFAPPLFMGVAMLIGRKLVNNDREFFRKFTTVRAKYELLLLQKRHLIGMVSQQIRSNKRSSVLSNLFEFLISEVAAGNVPSDSDIASNAGLKAALLVPKATASAARFTDDTKSAVYLRNALSAALRCPICDGYLNPRKSLSYDHDVRRRDGGSGSDENCQLVHPWCNQSQKH